MLTINLLTADNGGHESPQGSCWVTGGSATHLPVTLHFFFMTTLTVLC